MWVNEFYHGFYIHEDNLWSSIPWIQNFTIYGLYKTGNNLWIATKEAGIFKYDVATSKFVTYNDANVLPTNYMFRITGDPLGNIYAGTGFQGALKFNGSVWTNYTTSNSPLPSNNVFTVACDGLGNVWFGTDQGLARLSSLGTWTVYDSITTGLPGNYIRTLVPRNDNLIVASGYGGLGILNINTDVWTVFNTQNSNLPVNRVFDAAVSDGGDIWITLVYHGIAVLPQYLPTGIAKGSGYYNLNISPNPSNKVVNISGTGMLNGLYRIDLLSSDGKSVLKITGDVVNGSIQKTLNVSGFISGLYILKIYQQNSIITKKLVIE